MANVKQKVQSIKNVAPHEIEYIDPIWIDSLITYCLYKIGIKKGCTISLMQKDIITRIAAGDERDEVVFL